MVKIISDIMNIKGAKMDEYEYLAQERVAINDAAQEAKTRLGQSFLSDYDSMGVD